MATKLNKEQKKALKHKNVLGAGATKRRKLKSKDKGAVIAKEWAKGTLHAGSGKIVSKGKKGQAQMKAIIASESGAKMKKTKPITPEYGTEILAKEPMKKAVLKKWNLLKAQIDNLSSFVDLTKPLLEEKETPEGNAAKAGFTEDQADPNELQMGTQHEMEHTDDQEKAKQTALDHLVEDPQYYTHLEAMEAQNKEGGAVPEGEQEASPEMEDDGREENPYAGNDLSQEEMDKISQFFPKDLEETGDEVQDTHNLLMTFLDAKKQAGLDEGAAGSTEEGIEQGPTDETATAEVPENESEAVSAGEEEAPEEAPEEDMDVQLKRKELEFLEEKNKIELDFLKQKRQMELEALKRKHKNEK